MFVVRGTCCQLSRNNSITIISSIYASKTFEMASGGQGALPINASGLPPIHVNYPLLPSLLDVGIFKDTLFPSLGLHSGLAVIAYSAGRFTDVVETKDWLWPAGQVINAWWSAVGRRLAAGVPVDRVWWTLSRPERLILLGVTLWGGRLFYRVASRSLRRGRDEPRYDIMKKEDGFWNKALLNIYAPEALFQTIICLSFTAPFKHQGAVLTGYHPVVQGLSIGLFSVGFALEVLADWQLDQHRKLEGSDSRMAKEGVWSLCRHPK